MERPCLSASENQQGDPAKPVFLQATGDFPAELRLFYGLGVDGVFTDNPDVAVATRSQHAERLSLGAWRRPC